MERFACDGCGKSYRWKPELAGRRVKCACGHVMPCPADDGDDEGLYDVADEPTKSAVATRVQSAVAAPVIAAPTLAYRAPKEDTGGVDLYFPNKVIDLYAPLCIIAGSTVIEVIVALIRARGGTRSVPFALGAVGAEMIFGTAVMLAGIFLAAKFRGISFGAFWTAVLKLAAISVGPSAAMALTAPILGIIPGFGGLLNWVLGFILYFALIGTFFDLDQSDTWYCVMVIFLVKVVLFFAIMFGIFGLLAH
jgi:hypothetical protein